MKIERMCTFRTLLTKIKTKRTPAHTYPGNLGSHIKALLRVEREQMFMESISLMKPSSQSGTWFWLNHRKLRAAFEANGSSVTLPWKIATYGGIAKFIPNLWNLKERLTSWTKIVYACVFVFLLMFSFETWLQ